MTERVTIEHNGEQFTVEVPDGTPDSEVLKFVQSQQPQNNRGADIAHSALTGANALAPGLLGLPVDTATNIMNLGISGYGALKSLLPQERNAAGVADAPNLPQLIDPASQVGGSAWFRNKFNDLMGADVFSPVDPSDPMQRAANIGGTIAASGMVAPAAGIKQAAGNVARMTPSAIGGAGANLAFPDQPLAPAVGALAAPAAIGGVRAALPTKTPPKMTAVRANRLGYKVLPKSAKETLGKDVTQGAAGPVPLKQMLSAHNQKITNSLIKKDLGIPDDIPITPESLTAVRQQAGNVYSKVSNLGKIRVDAQYINNMKKLKSPRAFERVFPGAIKKNHIKEVKKYDVRQMDSEAIVSAVKQLRRDADAGFNSLIPEAKDMARLQGKIANELESLLARRMKKTTPGLYPEFENARKTIAKTYQVEKALTEGDNVNAVALGRALTKGKPMSGSVRDVAEFGKNFKHEAQANAPQTSNFRPMDLASLGLGFIDPKLASAVLVRPSLRKIITSDFYQNKLTALPKGAITSGQMRSVLNKPESAQATALIMLLNKAIDQNIPAQPTQQSEQTE